jgi:hypothetical protein
MVPIDGVSLSRRKNIWQDLVLAIGPGAHFGVSPRIRQSDNMIDCKVEPYVASSFP